LPKELKEHKTINNKDGIKLSLHALGVGCVPSLRVGEKDPKYDQYQRSYNPTPKAYYLSVSQARPMLTTGVVRSRLASVTHDETGVKLSCFHSPP